MISLYGSLRAPRVQAAAAKNALYERFEACQPIGNCVEWNGQDQYGREVPYYSARLLTAGHDPMHRIEVENLMRPNYQAAINTGDQVLNLDRHQYSSTFGLVDTAGLHRERGLNLNAIYSIPQPTYDNETTAFYEEAARFARSMQRVHETNRFMNA